MKLSCKFVCLEADYNYLSVKFLFLLALFVMAVQAQADSSDDQVASTDDTQQGTDPKAFLPLVLSFTHYMSQVDLKY